jgi:hypothetical protein
VVEETPLFTKKIIQNIMYISLPVYWIDEDSERDEDLIGTPVKYTLSDLFLNTNHVCSYHKDDNGATMIRTTNGDVFRSPIKLEDFAALLKDCCISVELMPSDN